MVSIKKQLPNKPVSKQIQILLFSGFALNSTYKLFQGSILYSFEFHPTPSVLSDVDLLGFFRRRYLAVRA